MYEKLSQFLKKCVFNRIEMIVLRYEEFIYDNQVVYLWSYQVN